jgi:hypothetical protein
MRNLPLFDRSATPRPSAIQKRHSELLNLIEAMPDDRKAKLRAFDCESPSNDGMPYDQWERIRSERAVLIDCELRG